MIAVLLILLVAVLVSAAAYASVLVRRSLRVLDAFEDEHRLALRTGGEIRRLDGLVEDLRARLPPAFQRRRAPRSEPVQLPPSIPAPPLEPVPWTSPAAPPPDAGWSPYRTAAELHDDTEPVVIRLGGGELDRLDPDAAEVDAFARAVHGRRLGPLVLAVCIVVAIALLSASGAR